MSEWTKRPVPPPKVFAARGKDVRFLVSHDGATVHAQVRHVDLHMVQNEIDMRGFWHSAGAVPLRDLQVAAKASTLVRFSFKGRCSHAVDVTGRRLPALLVALDQWHEAGSKATRKPKEVAAD